MVDKNKVRALINWQQRRREKGMEPNADALWAKIKETWPHLTQEEWEALFQETK